MYSKFNIGKYLSDGIENIVKNAIKASLKYPKESIFITKFALANRDAALIRENYEKKGKHIPSFLICSITENCNLNCIGCYSKANHLMNAGMVSEPLSIDDWKRVFQEATDIGISFILIAGGEPFMRPEVIEVAAEYKKILFPVFTNGTLVQDKYLKLFDKNRNLLPVMSVEGCEEYTDYRRGNGIYAQILLVMQKFKDKGIFFGASITVTKNNFHNITSDTFMSDLYLRGCKVLIFVEYVPIGDKTGSMVLSDNDRDQLDRKLRLFRLQYTDMIILSFPGDEKSTGGCLAAGRGFFHINSGGDAEPCPFSPYSDTNIKDCTLLEALQSPLFYKLSSEDILLREHTGGCVLYNQEDEVKRIVSGNMK